MSVGATNPTDPSGASGGEQWSGSSGSTSSSSESWRDPQSIWGGQSPYLEALYKMGGERMQSGFPQAMGGQASQLFGQASSALGSMMNPGENPQMRAYGDAVGRDFNRNIMPGIQSGAGMAGQMGGSRQGIAEGVAAGEARQQMQDFGAQLYDQDRDRMMQASAMAPSLAKFGMDIPWYAMQQYAGLLGRPTVLGGAAGSTSSSSGSQSASSYGYNYAEPGGGGGGGWDVGLPFL